MTQTARTGPDEQEADRPASPRGGPALAVIAAAQLMLVLNGSLLTTELPGFLASLDPYGSGTEWFVKAYVPTFGGLLPLGGRAGDVFGRRRVFRAGTAVLVLASLLGVLAQNGVQLAASGLLHGAGAAVVAPTVLSLLVVNFPEGRPRGRAVGVYVAMTGAGLLLGNVLIHQLERFLPDSVDVSESRRVMLLGFLIGLAVLAGSKAPAEGERGTGGLDAFGAVLRTGGLLALLYGLMRGAEDVWPEHDPELSSASGWSDPFTLAALAAGLVLLAVLPLRRRRSGDTTEPPRPHAGRDRAGACVALLLVGASTCATLYFLASYQELTYSSHYSIDYYFNGSVVTLHLGYLPFCIGMAAGAVVGHRFAVRLSPRRIAAPALAIAAGGTFWFTALEPGSPYLPHIMPPMLVTGTGLGAAAVPLVLMAVSRVGDQVAGAASALPITAQAVGAALGVSVPGTVSLIATRSSFPRFAEKSYDATSTDDSALMEDLEAAVVHGYAASFLIASALLVAALIVVLATMKGFRRNQPENGTAVSAGRPRLATESPSGSSVGDSPISGRRHGHMSGNGRHFMHRRTTDISGALSRNMRQPVPLACEFGGPAVRG